ncbi:hypothetical protein [Desulfosarcina alkanivorans]|uniref:hypothetical protein n=1 Tax=Desulfosarcina alkanivorans TaxID=571177 RepID=UPI0012D2A414|nr:hypothetical protein [Desulfosarcina alkanivorans]
MQRRLAGRCHALKSELATVNINPTDNRRTPRIPGADRIWMTLGAGGDYRGSQPAFASGRHPGEQCRLQ